MSDTSASPTSAIRGVVFDVNETLSDMSLLADVFAEVGAPRALANTWFACVLRDGFALAAAGEARPFSDIASEQLRVLLSGADLSVSPDAAVSAIMTGFTSLDVHADVGPALRALRASGIAVMTLSNGAAGVARALLERAGLSDTVDAFLTVEGNSRWKPAPDSYDVAVHAADPENASTRPGFSADELLLVAVHPWDINGAAAAGLRTAWLNRDGSIYPAYFRRPDHELTDLRRLAAVVDGGV